MSLVKSILRLQNRYKHIGSPVTKPVHEAFILRNFSHGDVTHYYNSIIVNVINISEIFTPVYISETVPVSKFSYSKASAKNNTYVVT